MGDAKSKTYFSVFLSSFSFISLQRCSIDVDVAEAYLVANGWSLQKSLQAFDRDARGSEGIFLFVLFVRLK